MTDLAWMKTYIGDEAALIGHLTTEEFGAYELLRRHYWQFGGLPDDDMKLMRITRVAKERWDEVRSAICDLFEERWSLPKLDEMRSEASEKRERKVAAGRKGAQSRWGNADANGRRNGSANADANRYANATAIDDAMPEPMADAMDNQWPPAPAPEHIRYDERLAPTHVHAREASGPIPIETPDTDADGYDFLVREGLWPKQVEALLPILMDGKLQRAQINEMLERKRS